MGTSLIKKSIVIISVCYFAIWVVRTQAGIEVESQIEQAAVLARSGKIQEAENILLPMLEQKDTVVKAGHELGLIYYESNDLNKAVTYFKTALAAAFSAPATTTIQKAVDLSKSGKADEAEKILLSLFDEEESASRCRHELGLIYESQGKLNDSALMFYNALRVIANDGAEYVGVKTCKKCHLKLYKSWEKTATAKSFDNLKPGVNVEAKKKNNFDPQKDYTKDPTCLECHTTGFGMPGGYVIPKEGDSESVRQAKNNAGITCEGCHGPGSKYIAVFKKAMTKKQKYTQRQLCDLGHFKVNGLVCSSCHNPRNPTDKSDYHFNFENYKHKHPHEHCELKYRME